MKNLIVLAFVCVLLASPKVLGSELTEAEKEYVRHSYREHLALWMLTAEERLHEFLDWNEISEKIRPKTNGDKVQYLVQKMEDEEFRKKVEAAYKKWYDKWIKAK